MDTQSYGLALLVVDRAMRELTDGADSGSTREGVAVLDADGPTRFARTRRVIGAAMIRAGERLKERSQPDAAFSG